MTDKETERRLQRLESIVAELQEAVAGFDGMHADVALAIDATVDKVLEIQSVLGIE